MNDSKILPFSIEMLKVTLVTRPGYELHADENPPEKYLEQAIAFFNRSSSPTVEPLKDGILIPISEQANIEMYHAIWSILKRQQKKQKDIKEKIPDYVDLEFTPTICIRETFDNFLHFSAEAG